MTIALTIIHVIVCFFLVVVVLLQSGKAADLAGAFGGMGSQTAFGPRGSATVLSKATTIAAAVFMITSLSLAILATRNATSSGSVLERQKAPASKTLPSQPAGPVAPGKTPSVSITPEGGKTTTMPLNVPQPGKQPASQQPPAKQPPAPQAPPKK
jgi:preprotein translocase subunit SecG